MGGVFLPYYVVSAVSADCLAAGAWFAALATEGRQRFSDSFILQRRSDAERAEVNWKASEMSSGNRRYEHNYAQTLIPPISLLRSFGPY